MSEPFIGARQVQEFLTWARKKYWGSWDPDEEDDQIYKKEDLSRKLQRVYGWSERETLERIDRALREFSRG